MIKTIFLFIAVVLVPLGVVMFFHYLKIKLDSYNEWYKEYGGGE